MKFMHCYTRQIFEKFYADGLWTNSTLLDAIETHALTQPQRCAIVDRDNRLDYKTLQQAIDQLAANLAQQGIGAGDIVAVQLPNCVHLVLMMLSLLKLGAAYLPLNVAYRQHDVSRIFQIAKPCMHVFPRKFKKTDYAALARDAAQDLSNAPRAFAIDIDAPVEHLLTGDQKIGSFQKADPDALFLLGCTSGSTGDPKLYAHTQNTQFNEARILGQLFKVTSDDAFLVCFPMTHRGALMFGFLLSMVAGAKLVIHREYNAEAMVDVIDAEQISAFFVIPTQARELIEIARRKGSSCASIRLLMMAGAPVPPDLITLIKERWPSCFPITGYGTSESGYSTCVRLDDPPEKLQSCGRASPGQEVCIDPMNRSKDGEGEILVKGSFLFAGYFADQHQTTAAFSGDWFHTGDLGRISPDGSLYITGRLKNTINRGGLKIQAEEIERIVLQHSAVSEAVAVGIPDEYLGERTVICVVPRTDCRFDNAMLISHLVERGVTKFKWPEFLVVCEELPRSSVGKQDRATLRRQIINMPLEKVMP